MLVQNNIPLSRHTTLAVGGPADHFVVVENLEQLREANQWAQSQGLSLTILGGGSNLLVHDQGYRGLIALMKIKGIVQTEEGLFQASAGEVWDEFVAHTVALGFSGVECLSGIPGTVGACPIQNIGAYGQEVAETIVAVEVFERATGQTRRLSADQCGFSYRDSHFKGRWAGQFIVVAVEFRLRRQASALRYGELSKKLEGLQSPTPDQVRQAVLEIRASKSMVYDPGDPNHRSAGSFFMNPIVSTEKADLIASRFSDMPRYPAGPNQAKLSAAWLIERSGFPKGYIKGEAGLSSNHVLALINRGQARAGDVWALAEEVQSKVQEQFGVELHPEPVRLGF